LFFVEGDYNLAGSGYTSNGQYYGGVTAVSAGYNPLEIKAESEKAFNIYGSYNPQGLAKGDLIKLKGTVIKIYDIKRDQENPLSLFGDVYTAQPYGTQCSTLKDSSDPIATIVVQ